VRGGNSRMSLTFTTRSLASLRRSAPLAVSARANHVESRMVSRASRVQEQEQEELEQVSPLLQGSLLQPRLTLRGIGCSLKQNLQKCKRTKTG